jgi:hypothetical protein
MAEVEFLTSVGGDGTKISDDSNKITGLGAGGHRARLVKMFQQSVAVAAFVVTKAQQVAALALNVQMSPATNATCSTAIALAASGTFSFDLDQDDKAFLPGMALTFALQSDLTKQMTVRLDTFTASTGVGTATISSATATGGSYSGWNVFRGGSSGGVPITRAIAVAGGLLTGGGTLAADFAIGLAKATAAQIAAGTSDDTVITPKGQMDALAPQVLADAATINLNMALALSAMVTITATRTFGKPTNYHRGQVYDVEVWNTGAFGLNYHACYEGGANGLPIITAGAGKMTLLTMRCIDADATNPRFRVSASLDAA